MLSRICAFISFLSLSTFTYAMDSNLLKDYNFKNAVQAALDGTEPKQNEIVKELYSQIASFTQSDKNTAHSQILILLDRAARSALSSVAPHVPYMELWYSGMHSTRRNQLLKKEFHTNQNARDRAYKLIHENFFETVEKATQETLEIQLLAYADLSPQQINALAFRIAEWTFWQMFLDSNNPKGLRFIQK